MLRTGLTIAAATAALSLTAAFSPQQQAAPSVIEVQLKNYEFAPELFAASTLDPATAAMVHNGTVQVGEAGVDLRLTPNTPGTYAFHCTHFMHSAFGMKGTAVVD